MPGCSKWEQWPPKYNKIYYEYMWLSFTGDVNWTQKADSCRHWFYDHKNYKQQSVTIVNTPAAVAAVDRFRQQQQPLLNKRRWLFDDDISMPINLCDLSSCLNCYRLTRLKTATDHAEVWSSRAEWHGRYQAASLALSKAHNRSLNGSVYHVNHAASSFISEVDRSQGQSRSTQSHTSPNGASPTVLHLRLCHCLTTEL